MTSIDVPPRQHCLGATAQGRPCRAWPVKGSTYCVVHNPRPTDPPGDQDLDPPQPELATIDDLIDQMYRLLSTLLAMIDQAEDMDSFLKGTNVYSRCVVHLCSLLRTKQSLADPCDDFLESVAEAAEKLAEEHGWTFLQT